MKKLISAFLAFVMIFTTVAPATTALAKSLPTATASEMQMPTPKDGVSNYQINVEEPKADKDGNYIMSYLGGAININYPKDGVKKEDVVVKFFKDGEEINPDYNIGVSEAGSHVVGAEIKSQIPRNETGKEIIYNIFVKEKSDADFDTKNSIEIKVKPLGDPVITGLTKEEVEKTYDDANRNILVDLEGFSLNEKNVLYEVTSDFGKPEDLKIFCKAFPGIMAVVIGVPKNETEKTIEYKISFFTKNNSEDKHVLIIKSLPKNGGSEEPEEPTKNTVIKMVKIDKETLNPGETSVSGKIFGSDLDVKNIITEVTKSENAKEIEVVLGKLNEKKTNISYVVNVPDNKTATDWEYEIKFSAKNNPTDIKTVKLTVVGSNEVETGKEFDVKASTDKLPSEGGEVLFYITGDGFDISTLKSVIKIEGQRTPHKVIFSEDSTGKARFVGKLTLPQNRTEIDEIYDISINKVDMSADNPFVQKPFKVTVLAKSSTPVKKTATLKVYNNEIEAKGGDALIYIDTKDYTLNEFKTEVKLNGNTLDNPSGEFKVSDKAEHNFMYSLPIAENKTEFPKNYEITVLDNNNKIIGTEKFTQKAAEKEVNSTVFLEEESKEVESSVGSVSFDLFTTPKADNEKVKLQITKDGEVQNLNYTVSGAKAKKTIEIEVPENKTGSDEVYTIKFNANGSETEFQDTPVFTLTVKPAPEEKKAVVEEVYVLYPNLPLKSVDGTKLEQSLNIRGTDLDLIKDKSYEIYEKVNGEYVKYSTEKPALQGTDNLQSVRIPIKEAEESKEFKIVVKLDDIEKEVFFKQSETGNTSGLQNIIPEEAFTKGEDTLVINFFSKIEEAAPSKLKEAITIMAGSKAIKLSEEDIVEIKGSQVIVKFKDPVFKDKSNNYALNIAERSYSNGQALNKTLKNYTITKNSCSIDSFKFIEGYQLDSNGGKVEIKITGHNLLNENNESNLKLKIQGNSKEKKSFYDSNREDNIINDLEITGTDTEQTITFTAPANTEDKVKTYTILVSRDGGKLYTASLPATLEERFTKSVIAVLPEGADPNEKMIDFIQIQSYGTQGGGEEADITHTDLPTGQGSKKTLVWIYGTNLDASKARVRLKDVNGVYWSPIHDAVYDSSDRVMMTMMDAIKDGKTFGMSGKGNNMLMEVILPNGYKPDGQEGFPEGVTFEYEVAPDGVNFNQDTKVTGTVLYDGTPKSLDLKEKVIDITVRHINEDGKDLVEPLKTKAYKHLPPNTLFYGLPLVDESGEFKDSFIGYKVKDTEELVKGRDSFGHNKFYYDGKTIPELLNSKGELVLVYKGKTAAPIEEIPEIKATDIEKEVVKKGEDLDLTDNIKNLPEGSKVKDITEPKIDTNVAGEYKGKVEVTFPKGSKRIVEVPVVVEKVEETEPTEPSKPTDPTTPTEPTEPKEPTEPTPGVPTTPTEPEQKDNEIKNTDTFKEVFEKVDSTRISGKNRQLTAVEVSKRLYKQADTIVLTSSSEMIDSLTSSPFGITVNGPTLFVEKDTILQEVLGEIKRLQPKKIIIAGGDSVISEKVQKQIEAMGVEVERTAGKDRFQTAIKLGEQIRRNSNNKTDIILANGYNFIDALTAGSLAAKMNIPILLTGDSSLNSITEKAIKEWGIKNVIVVGGDQQVSEGIISKLQKDGLSVERIAGRTRVETALKLADKVNSNPEKVIFANGRTYADALIASYLSVEENAPIILINKDDVPVSVKEYLREKKIKDSIILGGDSNIANVK